MLRLRPYIRGGQLSTPESAAELLESAPELVAYLNGISSAGRSAARKTLAATEGVGAGVVELIFPDKRVGRLARGSIWSVGKLSAAAEAAIESAGLIGDPALWTPAAAARAAAALVVLYPSQTTAAVILSRTRAVIYSALGEKAAAGIISAMWLPEITRGATAIQAAAQDDRKTTGLIVPERWASVDALRERVQEWLKNPIVSPGALADLMVVLSSRPGEVEGLVVGERGGVRGFVAGVLKKRGLTGVYPIVSAIGVELAEAVLESWQGLPIGMRSSAMRGLPAWLKTISPELQRRDLRTIGADLAVRAAALAGGIANAAQERDVRQRALRHEVPADQAVDHYTRVVHTTHALEARIREMGLAEREALEQFLADRAADLKPAGSGRLG